MIAPVSACPLLCPGWSHWGFSSARADSQGGTPGSCLALYFASSPSVNERSTLASPFCFWSGTFPRGFWYSGFGHAAPGPRKLNPYGSPGQFYSRPYRSTALPSGLLYLGFGHAAPGPRKSNLKGLSWTIPLETVPIGRSPFWLVILSPSVTPGHCRQG